MNRRELLAAHAAAMAASPAQGAETPKARPQWIENGIIDAGGSHEPYSFVVRRGGQRQDARRQYERAGSEETILALKAAGVEVFHTHLYKGAGMAHERAEMEDARRVAAIAHRHGLRVDSYIQWNTLLYETFFAEEPRAKDWVQRDEAGKPILLRYGYQQSFRYRPCFANPEYRAYLARIVRFAIEEVKTDFIHFDNFDNFDLNAEPDSCHCPQCVEGFRHRLRTRYTAAQRRERFGFDNVDHVNPPLWNRTNPPEKLDIIFDPAIQEWIDFRCQTMADALGEMARLAAGINPEVVIEVNPHGITGGNRAWEAGLDHARFLRHTQVFWPEEADYPDLKDDGRLVSTIRSFKLARRFDNILFTYLPNEAAAAECLAFNQTIGFAGSHPLAPHMRRYIDFYRAHRELYTGARDAGNVAVLRSFASIAYHHSKVQLAAILVEQALIESHIPFDLVFDEHLRDLSQYRVLILPDSECLSDGQLDAIRRFVEGGGGLIASGLAGLYDPWRRPRTRPGLAGLIDGQPEASEYEETVVHRQAAGKPSRRQAGAGRTVYFPGIEYDGELPAFGSYFAVRNTFWKAPRNMAELAAAIEWTAGGSLPVKLEAPRSVVLHLTAQMGRRRMLLHLVNYNRRQPVVENLAVSCRVPAGAVARRVRLVSPDAPEVESLEFQAAAGAASFRVPSVRVYTIAEVSW
jgi:hypothetical protein